MNEPQPVCPDPDSGNPALVDTVWYRFKGTGGNVLVNTLGSDFDTVLAVYRSTSLTPATAFCDDDPAEDDFPGETWSEVYMPTVAGADYLIQVGGCGGAGCGDSEGGLVPDRPRLGRAENSWTVERERRRLDDRHVHRQRPGAAYLPRASAMPRRCGTGSP